MAFRGGEFAVPGSPTPLSTLLGITEDSRRKAKFLSLQSITGAANPVYVGESNLTATTNRHRELATAGSLAEFHADALDIDLSQVYVVGTVAAGNIVFCTYLD